MPDVVVVMCRREFVGSGRLNFTAPKAVRAALAGIGRTECVSVSPDGSRLALAAFTRNRVYVFRLAIDRDGDAVEVQLSGHVTLASDAFRQPHGCTFLDREHLLVCNRGGDVTLVPVPEPDATGREARVRPLRAINGKSYLSAVVKTPGSVAAYGLGGHRYRAFVCSDQWHFVTSHLVTLGRSSGIADEGIRIENSLQIPDGISLSGDHRWIAISNHVHGEIQIFENSPQLDRRAPPAASLAGSVCPHGLGFDAAGNLYVADAASPYVHVYDKPDGDWQDRDRASSSFRLLDNETFYRGRYASREGGVKGLHVHQDAGVLVTTHKLGLLEFYDLSTLRSQVTEVDAEQLAALRVERDAEIARSKAEVLERRWSLACRVRKEIGAVTNPAIENMRLVLPLLDRLQLAKVNRRSRESILDAAGPVLSMTSHSARIAWVHLAIESIARGTLKPRRLLLWLSDEEPREELPDTLRRLEDRGLEVQYTQDLGPHTKYFPFVASEPRLVDPLVTADDDIIYPRDWLAALVHAHRNNPTSVHCHRARRMRINRYHFEPYESWGPTAGTDPHPLNFAIGAAGVIYPASLLRALKRNGAAFRCTCPTADDIWLHRVAYREGILVAQVAPRWPYYPLIPATQRTSLSEENVHGGANQLQLAETYSPEDRANLFQLVVGAAAGVWSCEVQLGQRTAR